MSDKDIAILSAPGEHDTRPVPPKYEPLYTIDDIKRYSYEPYLGGHGDRVVDEVDVINIVEDYDKALSEARFKVWQLEGLLRGKTNGN